MLASLHSHSQGSYLLTVVVIRLWHIWKARNSCVFNNLQLDPFFISCQISLDLQQFQLSGVFLFLSFRQFLQSAFQSGLASSFFGFVKLNCDVSWKDQFPLAAIVLITSDCTSTILFDFTKKLWCSMLLLVRFELFQKAFYGLSIQVILP